MKRPPKLRASGVEWASCGSADGSGDEATTSEGDDEGPEAPEGERRGFWGRTSGDRLVSRRDRPGGIVEGRERRARPVNPQGRIDRDLDERSPSVEASVVRADLKCDLINRPAPEVDPEGPRPVAVERRGLGPDPETDHVPARSETEIDPIIRAVRQVCDDLSECGTRPVDRIQARGIRRRDRLDIEIRRGRAEPERHDREDSRGETPLTVEITTGDQGRGGPIAEQEHETESGESAFQENSPLVRYNPTQTATTGPGEPLREENPGVEIELPDDLVERVEGDQTGPARILDHPAGIDPDEPSGLGSTEPPSFERFEEPLTEFPLVDFVPRRPSFLDRYRIHFTTFVRSEPVASPQTLSLRAN